MWATLPGAHVAYFCTSIESPGKGIRIGRHFAATWSGASVAQQKKVRITKVIGAWFDRDGQAFSVDR